MRVARTETGLPHRNTVVLRHLKIYFQRFPGKGGSDAERGIADVEYTLRADGWVTTLKQESLRSCEAIGGK